MKVKVTRIVEAKDCTCEFLKKGENPDKSLYAIVKISKDNYAVVNNVTYEAIVEFKNKTKIYENTWLLTLLDNTQCVMHFDGEFVRFSSPFLRTIKMFKHYLLIEKTKGERKLMRKKDSSCMFDWVSGNAMNEEYVILELPNSRYAIVKKQGLEIVDIEFDDYIYNSYESNIIIIEQYGKYSVVRIDDFVKSPLCYKEILEYVIPDKKNYIVKYVIVTYPDEKKAIMRMEDFNLTTKFDDVKPITYEYALVSNDGKEEILRLSDFQAAKFD